MSEAIIDVGCGDWQSSRFITFGGAEYTGFDLVESLIQHNRATFGSALVRFESMPDDPRDLPKPRLLIMKDVLQNMTNERITFHRDHVFPNYRFCLITNSWKAINYAQNGNMVPGHFRSLDLHASPYDFRGAYVVETWNEWERMRTLLLVNPV